MAKDLTFIRRTAGWEDTFELTQASCYVICRDGGVLNPDKWDVLDDTNYLAGRIVIRETYKSVPASALAIEIREYRDGRVEYEYLLQPVQLTSRQELIIDAIGDTFGFRRCLSTHYLFLAQE